MKLVWTDEAVASLRDIHEYIARDSRNYATAQKEKILGYEDQIRAYTLA